MNLYDKLIIQQKKLIDRLHRYFGAYFETFPHLWQILCFFTNIFGYREVLAYVTSPEKNSPSRRLFFSTVFPEQMQIFCAWQEKSPLNQTGSDRMKYIPLFCYSFRWNLEVSYDEQKTFWSFCSSWYAAGKELRCW